MPETLDVDRIAQEALKPRDQRSGAALDNGQFDVWPPLFWPQLPGSNIAPVMTDLGSY